MTATAVPGQYLLIRRLISRPGQLTFHLCWAPEGRATMTYFITIAGRRWPVEETFKTGKNVLGWDQAQVRTWDGINRHTAWSPSPSSARSPSATPSPAPSPSPPPPAPTIPATAAAPPAMRRQRR